MMLTSLSGVINCSPRSLDGGAETRIAHCLGTAESGFVTSTPNSCPKRSDDVCQIDVWIAPLASQGWPGPPGHNFVLSTRNVARRNQSVVNIGERPAASEAPGDESEPSGFTLIRAWRGETNP